MDREAKQNGWPKNTQKNRGQLQKPKEAQWAIETNIHGGPGGCGKCLFIYFVHFGGWEGVFLFITELQEFFTQAGCKRVVRHIHVFCDYFL